MKMPSLYELPRIRQSTKKVYCNMVEAYLPACERLLSLARRFLEFWNSR